MRYFLCPSYIFILLLCSCVNLSDTKYNNDNNYYYNDKCIVTEKGIRHKRSGKYNNDIEYVIIRRILDTTQYAELNGSNYIYNSYPFNEGDTMVFASIDKNRFNPVE